MLVAAAAAATAGGDGETEEAAIAIAFCMAVDELVGMGDAAVFVNPCLLKCLLCDPPAAAVGTGENRPIGAVAAVGV